MPWGHRVSPRGDTGFGYDPVFWVPEYAATMAELGPEIKNKISHRAKALAAFKELFRSWLARARNWRLWQFYDKLEQESPLGWFLLPKTENRLSSGRGAAWLARLLWEQEVGGSNPPVPTSHFDQLRLMASMGRFFV